MSDTKVTYIPNELASAVKGGFVTSSKEIRDKILNLNQEEINQSFTQSKDEILQQISDLSTDVDNRIQEALGNSPQVLETISQLSEDVQSLTQGLNSKADSSDLSALEQNFNEELNRKVNASDVYTTTQVDEKISEVSRNDIQIVDSIPENPVENTVYLIKDPDDQSLYNRFVYIDGQIIQLKDKDCLYQSIHTTNDNPNDDNVRTTLNVGNIPQGTSVQELSGKTLSELLDMILFKEEYPNPNYSHTISLNISTSLLKQDSIISQPNITAIWNNNIISDNNNIITKLDLIKPNNSLVEDWTSSKQSNYDLPGNWTWKLYYNYGEGHYNVTSNFGNQKEVTVPGANTYPNGTNNPLTKIVKVSKPILYGQGNNLTESSLYSINEQHTITVSIGGQAKVIIPWENSLATIEVDLGLGYMPVDGWTTTKQNGQIIMQKNDSYFAPVSHRITFTLRP